ncbi:aminofutalosine synthase MqnE [Hippea maritima]|uniref:Aminodeoxyfutalosine synthase n=1 Tax=Hippea maritima (strain ATCC 700847 / DSM 10411 / MH2) TaxID=760142 RepID=F2LVL1_HIPMA|nr:aminofutalosine synthase MqnE [Hippea maritima]AEA33795.1 putative menaquinone biosynthesis protein [Hippea maritima DSM 10411]
MSNFEQIEKKIEAGEPIDFEDARFILSSYDLIRIGKIARSIKLKKTSKKVYFVFNKHINYTNLCISKCKFCAFYRLGDEEDAYTMEIDEIIDEIAKMPDGIKEVHIVGGLHPSKPFSYYLNMVSAIKRNFPSVNVKAFTAVEIDYFSKLSGLDYEGVLKELKKAGLDSMPGGGAEVFSERVRKKLYPNKIPYEKWAEVHAIAHRLNIPTNATLLFGHIETDDEIIDHLFKLRKLQQEHPGFLCFIPLSFHPANTPLEGKIQKVDAVKELKVLALSRIILDNFPHIKAYWVMLSPKIGQIGLHFGADDIDGTIGQERVTHAAGAKSPLGLARDNMVEMIKNAGFIPVERDALYNEIEVYD